jgi:hypothetical protein
MLTLIFRKKAEPEAQMINRAPWAHQRNPTKSNRYYRLKAADILIIVTTRNPLTAFLSDINNHVNQPSRGFQ